MDTLIQIAQLVETAASALWTNTFTFALYLFISLELVSLYLWIHSKFTKYNELEAIGRGKVAPAITFSGAALGVTIPLMTLMAFKADVLSFMQWSAVAMLVQLVVMKLIDKAVPGELNEDNVAAAIFFAAGAIVAGGLNATAMRYLGG